jgi:DNA-directed RNA polymerase specialized sigma24 family protein
MAVGYASAQLRDQHLAEDAAQEAFLKAFVDLGQLHEPAAFPGWFRRIVYEHCDRIRRRRRLHLVPLEENQWEARVGRCHSWSRSARLSLSFYLRQYRQAEVTAFLET